MSPSITDNERKAQEKMYYLTIYSADPIKTNTPYLGTRQYSTERCQKPSSHVSAFTYFLKCPVHLKRKKLVKNRGA
jgi:hypothetical protein